MKKKAQPDKSQTELDLEKIGYQRVSVFILLAFAAYIVTWFLQLGGRVAILGAIRFEFLLAAGLGTLALVMPRQKPKTRCDLYIYIGLLLFAMIIEIPFSYNVDYSWTIFIDRVLKFSVMMLLIIAFVRSPTALKFFIAAFMLAWFKMGQEGLLGQITGSLVWENQGVMRLHGSTPSYQHPNSFSGFGLGMLPFIYYLFPVANRWQKLFLLVMVVFACTIILFTGSRTGYVGFILFALYVLWRSPHKSKFLGATVALFLVAGPFIPEQYVNRFESITGHEAEGHSKARRLEIWEDALIIFAEHPFGIGVSAFPTVREQRFGRVQDTHNLYLEVATNLGIQGLIIFTLLIVAIFRNILRLSHDLEAQLAALSKLVLPGPEPNPALTKHIADIRLMLAMLYAASAYVVVRLTVGFFGMDLYEIYWWFAMGIVIAVHNMNSAAVRITEYFLQGTSGAAAQAPGSAAPARMRQGTPLYKKLTLKGSVRR